MAWRASDFAWQPEGLQAVRLSPDKKADSQAPSGGSAEGQGSQPWTHPGSSDSSDGGAKPALKASAGGSKKGRRPGRAPAVCQVEGCGVNLDGGKPFYRLQRICERHARAAVITDASGAALRFCQQCTRLHPVQQFEGEKRSCVASLQRRMARKQRQQAADADGLAVVEASGKRRAQRRTSKGRAPRAAAAPAGGSGGGRPDSGSTPYDWSSNSHGSGSYGDARSQLSGGSGGTSGGLGGSQGPLPLLGLTPDLTGVPGMVPQPLPHSGPMAAPPLLLPPLGLGGSQPAQPLQPGSMASGTFNPFSLGGQQPAAASEPAPGPGLMDWTDSQGLLSPAAVRQLLQDDGLLGDGSAAPPPGSAAAVRPQLAAPAANTAAAPGQSVLTDDEVERLLVMDPDDLAGALLAATDAGLAWPGQQGSDAGLGCAHPAGSGSGASGSTTVRGLGNGMPAPQLAASTAGLGAFGRPAVPAASGACSAVPTAPALVPPAAAQWGSPEQLQQGVLGLALSSPPKPGAGAAMPGQPAATPPMPAGTHAAQPVQLPPSSLPLATWAGAQQAAELLHMAAAPVEQLAGEALALPPEAELVVIRFALKMYGLYPDQLPPQLQVELQEAMTLFPTVLSGAVRSGCTHLTASLLVTGEEAAALEKADGAAAALSRLLQSWRGGAGRAPWRLPPELPLLRVVAQAENSSAALLLQPLQPAGGAGGSGRLLAARGGAVCPLKSSLSDERLQLSLAGPPATTVGAARGLFRVSCADWQQLLLAGGQEAAAAAAAGGGGQRVLHCRARGRHVAVSLLWPGQAELDGDDAESSESPSPHTPVVRNSRNTPARDEERLLSAAAALQLAAEQQAAAEQLAAEQPAAARRQQQPVMATVPEGSEEEQDSQAASPAVSEPESDSEAEAAEEAITRRLLRTATSTEAWVPQALRQWGLYEFELAQGARLGPAVPVLVLPDSMAAIAAELCQLTAAEAQHPGLTARVLRLLSFVLLHLERQRQLAPDAAAAATAAAAAAPPPSALVRLAASARWLCALCVRCRWQALLRALLPATTACGAAPAEAVAAMDRLLPAGLLASAAAANSAPMLQTLGDWAVAAGHTWRPYEGAANGMTALHYAAALGPSLSAEVAAALVAVVGAADLTEIWRRGRAYGWTPRMVADATSNRVLTGVMDPLAAAAAAGEGEPPSRELFSTGAASSSSSGALKEGQKAAKAAAAAAEAGADEAAALLVQQQYCALELEKKGGGEPGSPDGLGGTDRLTGFPRLPASSAELQAWQQRPLSPALLALVGAATILVVVGLSAALRAGLYD